MTQKFFIHIPKNGGMSIRRAKLPNVTFAVRNTHKPGYSDQVQKAMKRIGAHHGFEHARWRDIDPKYRDYEFFAFVRNPWDRVVSRYMFAKKTRKTPNLTFEQFLDEREKYKNEDFYWHRPIKGWYSQFDYVTDENGVIKCNILRFEHYQEDAKAFLGLTDNLYIRNVSNGQKSEDKSRVVNRLDYKSLYVPETINKVGDWYKKDIETWGYDFGSGPTRNFWNQ